MQNDGLGVDEPLGSGGHRDFRHPKLEQEADGVPYLCPVKVTSR